MTTRTWPPSLPNLCSDTILYMPLCRVSPKVYMRAQATRGSTRPTHATWPPSVLKCYVPLLLLKKCPLLPVRPSLRFQERRQVYARSRRHDKTHTKTSYSTSVLFVAVGHASSRPKRAALGTATSSIDREHTKKFQTPNTTQHAIAPDIHITTKARPGHGGARFERHTTDFSPRQNTARVVMGVRFERPTQHTFVLDHKAWVVMGCLSNVPHNGIFS
ncbi:unnamed protein product [Ectocarpus sp. 12 AP-2014]